MLLDQKTYVVKERVALMKLTDTYDILDTAGQPIGIAKEEPPEWAKWLRLVVSKQLMPTVVNVYENEGGNAILSISRGIQLLTAKVTVTLRGRDIGYFQSKMFSLGGAFRIFDAQNREVGLVQGDWKGWNFQMLSASSEQLGTVTKKWAGLGKELFTSADTYAISLSDAAASRADVAPLLLAAGLAIDIVFKERK
ncbi:MAG TPA: phospholipid scramblase-related protein [Thermoanaerobaculia bacterium]|nr:phospholipid scramblase-related protein [Thermoanaerobaculia bacterium]